MLLMILPKGSSDPHRRPPQLYCADGGKIAIKSCHENRSGVELLLGERGPALKDPALRAASGKGQRLETRPTSKHCKTGAQSRCYQPPSGSVALGKRKSRPPQISTAKKVANFFAHL